MNILTVPSEIYERHVSLSSDQCTYCKTLWITASAKRPECKCEFVTLSALRGGKAPRDLAHLGAADGAVAHRGRAGQAGRAQGGADDGAIHLVKRGNVRHNELSASAS
jgi:hypothetical protein